MKTRIVLMSLILLLSLSSSAWAEFEEIIVKLQVRVLPPDKNEIRWRIESIPNQLQVIHQGGIEVSYPYKVNDCRTLTASEREVIFVGQDNVCYIIDATQPSMFRTREQWLGISGHTHHSGK